MKRVFETAKCEAVRNSIFWELRYEKHENQLKGVNRKEKGVEGQEENFLNFQVKIHGFYAFLLRKV